MAQRIAAIIAFGSVLVACGGGPVYTARQALIDVRSYDHYMPLYDKPYTNCLIGFLFDHMSPAQVKTVIQSEDFTASTPPSVVQAEQACATVRAPF